MNDEQQKPVEYMLVSKPLYVKSMKTLEALTEALIQNYKFIHNSGYNEETKQVSQVLLGDTIQAVNVIAEALESGIADRLTQNPNSGMHN